MDCTEILKVLIPIVGSVIVAYLAYHYAVKKLKKESRENIERKKYEAILEAHKSIYKILAYTTDTENDKTIIIGETDKNNLAGKTYYLRKNNAQEFFKKLTQEFYDYGNGLFLSSEVNKLIFEYRSLVFGLLLSAEKNNEDIIKIENTDLAKRMITINHEVRKEIRKSIGLTKRDLVSL